MKKKNDIILISKRNKSKRVKTTQNNFIYYFFIQDRHKNNYQLFNESLTKTYLDGCWLQKNTITEEKKKQMSLCFLQSDTKSLLKSFFSLALQKINKYLTKSNPKLPDAYFNMASPSAIISRVVCLFLCLWKSSGSLHFRRSEIPLCIYCFIGRLLRRHGWIMLLI